MTDNSSNFLSLEVVFQKKVSLHVNVYRLPVIKLVTPEKKSQLFLQARVLNGAKSSLHQFQRMPTKLEYTFCAFLIPQMRY